MKVDSLWDNMVILNPGVTMYSKCIGGDLTLPEIDIDLRPAKEQEMLLILDQRGKQVHISAFFSYIYDAVDESLTRRSYEGSCIRSRYSQPDLVIFGRRYPILDNMCAALLYDTFAVQKQKLFPKELIKSLELLSFRFEPHGKDNDHNNIRKIFQYQSEIKRERYLSVARLLRVI